MLNVPSELYLKGLFSLKLPETVLVMLLYPDGTFKSTTVYGGILFVPPSKEQINI